MLIAALLLGQVVATCNALDLDLPAGYAGWKSRGTSLESGEAVSVATVEASTVQGLPANTRPGRVAAINFQITKPGIYSVAVDQKGWINVAPAAGGEPLKSVSHREGESCWTISKLVRFQFVPGAYRLTLTQLAQEHVKAMLIAGE
jgi:hypothetical protein